MKEQTVFDAALERAPAERPSFLLEACGSDCELRERVEQLLGLHENAGSFLEHPATGGTTTLVPLQLVGVGSQIGSYKLLEQIGEGGMGSVYLAEQKEPVRRKVALKVIKPGMDTRQVVTRFEAERQALAMMNHSSIAKVLDAGATEAGRPYFVMELVKGLPITEFCDQHQLTTQARLELFITVCQAVQHAHQKGLIHRDLKPSNVLVEMHDVLPIPKIIDFGVAKAIGHSLTDKTLHTAFSQMVGTPLYMSPEQAGQSSIDVDTRSDIYSLGVLLYEMLTGSTPFERDTFEKAGFDEMRRMIREVDPPRPSARVSTLQGQALSTVSDRRPTERRKLSQQLRGELDWIVMKALEKDRNRRYQTATGLAADVQRYLDDEPVQACPPSARYLIRKFMWRNKAVLITASVVAAALVFGMAASAYQAIRATRAEGLAASRLVAEQNARQQAEASLQEASRQEQLAKQKQAETLLESSKAKAIADLLEQMLGSADPDLAKGSTYTVRQLLDEFAGGLGQQLQSQPEVERSIRLTIGKAYRNLGMMDEAAPQFQRTLHLSRELFGSQHEATAEALLDYGRNLFESGNLAEAEAYAREALTIFRPKNDIRSTLGALQVLQQLQSKQRKFSEAAATAEEAFAFAGQHPDERYPEIASILHALAWSEISHGRYAEAERLGRESVLLHRQTHGPTHPQTAWGIFALASAVARQSKHSEAESHYRQALAIFEKHLGEQHMSVVYCRSAIAMYEQDFLRHRAHVNYKVQIVTAGDYQLYLRWDGHDVASDSLYAQIVELADGLEGAAADWYYFDKIGDADFATDAWQTLAHPEENAEGPVIGSPVPAVWQIPTPGQYTLRIGIREDGAAADAFVLQLAELPAPRGIGPEESDRTAAGVFTQSEGRVVAEAEHFATAAGSLQRTAGTERDTEWRVIPQQEAGEVLHLNYRGSGYIQGLPDRTLASGTYGLLLNRIRGYVRMAESEQDHAWYERAVEAAAELIEESPDDPETYVEQARALSALNMLDAAETAFNASVLRYEALLSRSPESVELINNYARTLALRANLLEKAARLDEAERDYRHAVGLWEKLSETDPGNAWYRQEQAHFLRGLAQMLQASGRAEEAIETYRRSVRLNEALVVDFPSQSHHRSRLAHGRGLLIVTLAALHRGEEARTEVELLLTGEVSGDELNNIAWSLVSDSGASTDTVRMAGEISRKAVELAPNAGHIWNTLGISDYRVGDAKGAVAALQHSQQLRGGDSWIWFFRSMAHSQLGQQDEARRWYAQAVEWMDKHDATNAKLVRFRAEAELLLESATADADPPHPGLNPPPSSATEDQTKSR